MRRRLDFYGEWKGAAPDGREQFLAGLDRSFRPAMLLRLEAVHIHRELRRRDYVRKEDELPARELRAITQIQIFGKCVMLPPSGLIDARPPPQTGRSVEVKESAAAAPGGLLEQEMAIEKHRLHPREQRVAAVQMAPARLDHAHRRIGKKLDSLAQEIGLRDEVGIENTNEITLSRGESGLQSAGCDSCAVNAMDQLHVETPALQVLHARGGQFPRFVGGIIEDLDLQQLPRIIDLADRFEQALDNVDFVEDRQLHRHFRQFVETASRRHGLLPVFQEKVNNHIPVNPVCLSRNGSIKFCPK